MARRKTRNALKILEQRIGDDEEFRAMIDQEETNLEIAEMVRKVRKAASLTQKQLADLLGTQRSAIARLEDAKYSGHSLSMLRRIATALEMKVEVRFVQRGSRTHQRS